MLAIITSRSAGVLGEREQDADAEVEAVEQHVEQHREGDHAGPDQRQVEAHGSGSLGHGSSGTAASAVPGARASGEDPVAAMGPCAISRSM